MVDGYIQNIDHCVNNSQCVIVTNLPEIPNIQIWQIWTLVVSASVCYRLQTLTNPRATSSTGGEKGESRREGDFRRWWRKEGVVV